MRKNGSRFKASVLFLTGFALLFTASGCVRERTEEQSAALIALQNTVTYYETTNHLNHWEELVALAAANRADGIGINWSALDLPETPRVIDADPYPIDLTQYEIATAAYPGAVISSILKGEDCSILADSLISKQDFELGFFEPTYINQHIWAMITLNVAVSKDGYDYDKAASYLLTFQKEDGGFGYSVDSSESDVDLTGIASVALAPYYEKYRKSPEMKKLVSFYQERQTQTGGYEGFGGENPSTIATAIWGITALERNLPVTENGLTPLNALLAFQNEDGSFRGELEGEHVFDSYFTRQAAIALCDILNDVNTYTLLAEDAESYRIENVSGPAITISIDYPEASGLTDIAAEPLIVEEGSTALDAIVFYGKVKELPVSFSRGASSYVKGIGGVSEKAYGDTSGWIYKVNEEIPTVGASSIILQEGDSLSWLYVEDISETIME